MQLSNPDSYHKRYSMDNRTVDLVQITRRAKMTWEQADEFLKSHGVEMGQSKYEATKKYIKDSIADRIQYIASTEYADVHLQLLDGMKQQIADIENRKLKALEDGKDFLYVRLCETQIKTMHAVKEMYNSTTIVGGIDKIMSEMKKKLAHEKKSENEIKN